MRVSRHLPLEPSISLLGFQCTMANLRSAVAPEILCCAQKMLGINRNRGSVFGYLDTADLVYPHLGDAIDGLLILRIDGGNCH